MSKPDKMGLTPEAAAGYEQLFVPAIFHQWPAQLINVADISPGDDVLDVGCGTGVLTRALVAAVGEQGSVCGVDFSESMLGVAREKCPGVTFRQGNAMALPYAEESFDAVTSSFMLMFIPDPVQAICEMRRVLRPGGRLVVSVWRGVENNTVYGALAEATRKVINNEAGDMMEWPNKLGDSDLLESLFNAAGAGDTTITHHDGTASFPSVEAFVATEINAWLMAGSVSDEKMAELTIELRARVAQFASATGPITFPLNAYIAKTLMP